MTARTRVLFGGTFNPVHVGHGRLALETQDQLRAEHFMFVPSHQPPHKPQPDVSVAHRLNMLNLVVEQLNLIRGEACFATELCELERAQASYTVDTLADLRKKYPQDRLLWLIGMDSLVNLSSWHQWHLLTQHANLLVVNRPGFVRPQAGAVASWLKPRCRDLNELPPCGGVTFLETTPMPVSSSAIRSNIKRRKSNLYLLPNPVQSYIETHTLYS